MIRITDLNKYYNRGRSNEIHVLDGINLELPDRGMIAIFGRSGCGKTTLLNVIGGLDGFRSGSVTLDGRDVRRDTDALRGEYVGYIFQNYNLQSEQTCFENIADALRLCGIDDEEVIEERTMAALESVDMEKYHSRLPGTLSGGQQQRIAIARAIVKNPRIILADEPTGNLDEANTVMIMDLLKQISREHLVLLVTHEANLVDHYCDSVIELSDGRVVGIRENESAEGYFGRSKNDVYLGELEHVSVRGESTELEYYGEALDRPLRLTVVHTDGKVYVKLEGEGVHVIDEKSEVRLREGCFEEKPPEEARGSIDMSRLPAIHGRRFGRLFTLASSLRSGHRANFKNRKRSRRLLTACLALVAATSVFVTAVFGVSIDMRSQVSSSYNHNVFYVRTDDDATARLLMDAVGNAESGIDYTRLSYHSVTRDEMLNLVPGGFESFDVHPYQNAFSTNAVYLDWSAAEGLELIAGSREGLEVQDILITRAVAESLVKNSSLGYLSQPSDLIGMHAVFSYSIEGKNLRVAGIVDSDERAVYISPVAMAASILQTSLPDVSRGVERGIDVPDGETELFVRVELGSDRYPSEGDTVTLGGVPLRVSQVHRYRDSYLKWRLDRGLGGDTYDSFVRSSFIEDPRGLDRYEDFVEKYALELIAEYYSLLDEYMQECYLFVPDDPYVWLYCQKGIPEAAYNFALASHQRDIQLLYVTLKFHELNGRYPTVTEYNQLDLSSFGSESVYNIAEKALTLYKSEYEASLNSTGVSGLAYCYYVSDADYVRLSRSYVDRSDGSVGEKDEYNYGGGYVLTRARCHTVVHSVDPALTAAYLERVLGDGVEIVSPDSIVEVLSEETGDAVLANSIFLVILIALMCVCTYFIMRASMISRIREIGICRAIGVSKRNLVFRFSVESSLLFLRTAFPGYLVSSLLVIGWLERSALVESLFFYPFWLAAALLALMYGICLGFGIAPILSLLRHSPSAILAKYDI